MLREFLSSSESPDNLIGSSPLEVIAYLLKLHPRITNINLWVYTYVPLRVDEKGRNPYYLTPEQFFQDLELESFQKSLAGDEQLAFFSQVGLSSGETAHIPMMDFQLEKGEANLKLLTERLKHVGINSGVLLETGQSYHLYGLNLLTPNQWLDFLGRCLLTSVVHSRKKIQQIADPRYIGHSLRREGCTLRVTTRADKAFTPRVVTIL